MSIAIMGGVVLGGIIYCLYVLFSYFEVTSRLVQQFNGVQGRLEHERQLLGRSEAKVKMYQEDTPQRRSRCERLERWIGLLREQKGRLTAEKAVREAQGALTCTLKTAKDIRDEAIRRGISKAQAGR